LNVIVLASAAMAGAQTAAMAEQIGATQIRRVATSAELLQQVVRARPDVVLLDYETLAVEGQAAVRAADYTLRALRIPCLVVLPASVGERRYEIEASTEFEHFLVAPCSPAELAAAIEGAGGPPSRFRGQRAAAQEAPTVNVAAVAAPQPAPEPEDLFEFVIAEDPAEASTPGPFARPSDAPAGPPVASGFEQRSPTSPRRPTHDYLAVESNGFDDLVDELNRLELDEPSFGRLGTDSLSTEAVRFSTGSTSAVPAAADPADAADSTDIEAAIAAGDLPPVGEPGFVDDPHERTDLNAILGDSVQETQEITLPALVAGDLGSVPVARLLHALFVTRSSGRLRLTQQSLKREVVIQDGMPGSLAGDTTTADVARLISTFAWKNGQYVLAPLEPGVSGFTIMGNPLEIIHRGIRETMSLNDIAMALGNEMKRYPVLTSQLSSIAGNAALSAARQLLVPLRGDVTLEQAIGGAGAATEAFLEAVYFGLVSGIVIFRTRPSTRSVNIRFVEQRVSAFRGVRPVSAESRTPTLVSTPTPTAAANVSGRPPSPDAPPPVAAATPAAPVVDERLIISELQRRLDALQTLAPYGGFSLVVGCGPDRVTDRFYELVREYHPDRFATASPGVRSLAEKVFVRIRESQNELLAAERGQTVAAKGRPNVEQVAVPSGGGFGASAPVTGTRVPIVSSAAAIEDTAKRVSDVMERLRKRQTTGPGNVVPSTVPGQLGQGAATSTTPAPARSPLLNARATQQIAPDQLLRQAGRSLEQGANDKAYEYVQMAKSRGLTGSLIDAYEKYALYALERLSATDAEKWMERCLKVAEGPVQITQIETFWGHICRLREDYEQALPHYEAAVVADKSNAEAERWVRFIKSKQSKGGFGKSGEGFMKKLLSTKLTLPGAKPAK
jgi:CheY-like chemotaxis protein